MKAFLFMGLGASLGQNDLLSTDPSNHPTPRDGRASSFVSKHSVAASQSGGRGSGGAGARAVTYVTYLPAVLPLR